MLGSSGRDDLPEGKRLLGGGLWGGGGRDPDLENQTVKEKERRGGGRRKQGMQKTKFRGGRGGGGLGGALGSVKGQGVGRGEKIIKPSGEEKGAQRRSKEVLPQMIVPS